MTRCPRCDTHAASHRPDRLCPVCSCIVHDQESPRALDPAGWVKGPRGIWRHRDVPGGRAVRG